MCCDRTTGWRPLTAKLNVHRYIKRTHFLSRDDVSHLQPKLLDFGIARLVDAEHKITLDGTLLGTPGYMSPEQARGDAEIDVRTDVWGVGVVLYELLTGTPPFAGDNYNALLWAIVHEAPVPVTDLGAGDAELWSILGRALAKAGRAVGVHARAGGRAGGVAARARRAGGHLGPLLRATWHELPPRPARRGRRGRAASRWRRRSWGA
jgi:serine/threonine protein kinase